MSRCTSERTDTIKATWKRHRNRETAEGWCEREVLMEGGREGVKEGHQKDLTLDDSNKNAMEQ